MAKRKTRRTRKTTLGRVVSKNYVTNLPSAVKNVPGTQAFG